MNIDQWGHLEEHLMHAGDADKQDAHVKAVMERCAKRRKPS
jgi:hypothetical protein